MLEVFNNLFMSIAEQMGATLANTAYSVNIKERLDFSCALFDATGGLVANAPHVPVHLGSMSESVRTVARLNAGDHEARRRYMLNAPFNGGTHLPDVTVITPVFDEAGERSCSMSARAATMPISAGARRARPRRTAAHRRRRRRDRQFPAGRGGPCCATPRPARCWHPGAIPAATSTRTWPIWRRRSPPMRPAPRSAQDDRAASGWMSCRPICITCRTMPRSLVRRVIDTLKDGAIDMCSMMARRSR
jgi:hypothetical protein